MDLLTALAASYKCMDALQADILETPGEIVLADGCIIAKLKLLRHVFSGIEIALPTIGYVNVIPKTHLGLHGALLLIEQIINGLTF